MAQQDQSHFEGMDSVVDTWAEIKKIEDYEGVAGSLLFQKIFELAPSAMRLFTFADDFEEDTAAELYESQLFLRHASGVVKMLDSAIGMLGPDLEPLQNVLRGLGARHVEYGVLPEHYPIVGEALLSTLETALGDKWNDKVKSGWAGIYDIVSSSMVEGANQLIEEENRLCAKQAKEEAKKRKETQTQASLQAYAKPPPSPAAVFTSEVEHVQASWAAVKKIPNYTDVAGSILFKRVFQIAPGAMKMFSFARRFGTDSEEFYKHPLFLRHARGVVQMLDTAIGLLGHVEPLIQALRDLGARHVEYGVLPAHYPIVGEALFYTLEVALGDHQWNDQVKAGWTKIYSTLSTGMIQGAHLRIQLETRLREANEKNSVQETTQKKEATRVSFTNEGILIRPAVAPSPEAKHVQDTWKVLQQIPDYEQVAGSLLFQTLFELAPSTRTMYRFARTLDATDSASLYKHPLFRLHARGVVTMLDSAVSLLLEPDTNTNKSMERTLRDLGARHLEYGVQPLHYPLLGEALFCTLQALLAERWTVEVERGWRQVHDLISSSMLEGARRRIQQELEHRVRTKIENESKNKNELGWEDGLPPLIVTFAPRDDTVSFPHKDDGQALLDKRNSIHRQKANGIRQHVRSLRLARRLAACNAAA